MPISGDCLMKHANRGEAAALEDLLTRHYRDLHWLAERMVGRPEVARKLLVELYADAYLATRDATTQFDPSRGPVKGYLLALVGRLAQEWLMGRLDLSHQE